MSNYRLPSYGKVYPIGHLAIANIFKGPVVVQEKVDGSQFTFGKVGDEVFCRSKGKQLVLEAPEKMFTKAVASVLERAPLLRDGWVYRAEYLSSPKHNTLAYEREPLGNLVLFDAHPDTHAHGYTDPVQLRLEAERINVEVVPVLLEGEVTSSEQLKALLENDSFLGGCKVEGVVAKNYRQFNSVDQKFCVGKYVSEAFKERHQGEWKKSNPSSKDVRAHLIEQLRTEARWAKAVQHLRESGELTETPKDIGPLIVAAQTDILEEEGDHIRDVLFEHFWPSIKRGVIAGLPEWYKDQVLNNAFK